MTEETVERIELQFERFSSFLDEFAPNLSLTGMFVQTDTPPPIGSLVAFVFRLADGFTLLRGTGEVAWVRAPDPLAGRGAGMGLRFRDLDQAGYELVAKVVENRLREGGRPFDVDGVGHAGEARVPVEDREAVWPDLPVAPPEAGTTGSAFDPFAHADTRPFETPVRTPFDTASEGLYGADAAAAGQEPRSDAVEPRGAETAWRFRWRLVVVPLVALVAAAALLMAALWMRQRTVGGEEREVVFSGATTQPASGGSAAPGDLSAESPPAEADGAVVASLTAETQDRAPVGPPRREPAAVGEVASRLAAAAAPLSSTSAPPSTVTSIEWSTTGGETEVLVRGDGALTSDRYSISRPDAEPPREVLRIRGVSGPYAESAVVMDGVCVERIRTGFHPRSDGNELHLVADLSGWDVVILRVEERGNDLAVIFGRRSES